MTDEPPFRSDLKIPRVWPRAVQGCPRAVVSFTCGLRARTGCPKRIAEACLSPLARAFKPSGWLAICLRGGSTIPKTAVGVGLVVSEGFPMMDEFLDIRDGNREAQVVGKRGMKTAARHADHFAPLVEQRPPRVAGIDRRVGLEEKLAVRCCGCDC